MSAALTHYKPHPDIRFSCQYDDFNPSDRFATDSGRRADVSLLGVALWTTWTRVSMVRNPLSTGSWRSQADPAAGPTVADRACRRSRLRRAAAGRLYDHPRENRSNEESRPQTAVRTGRLGTWPGRRRHPRPMRVPWLARLVPDVGPYAASLPDGSPHGMLKSYVRVCRIAQNPRSITILLAAANFMISRRQTGRSPCRARSGR